jgi:hypothetical protein
MSEQRNPYIMNENEKKQFFGIPLDHEQREMPIVYPELS